MRKRGQKFPNTMKQLDDAQRAKATELLKQSFGIESVASAVEGSRAAVQRLRDELGLPKGRVGGNTLARRRALHGE